MHNHYNTKIKAWVLVCSGSWFKMNSNAFIKILNETVDLLYLWARNMPEKITSCKSGDDFELVIRDAVSEVLINHQLFPQLCIDYTPKSHRFPDIILTLSGKRYGLEVKSSGSKNKSWKINGNSILGSTRAPDILETYVIFGKYNKDNLAFKIRKAEECVENVVVTHSPRYLLNMELPQGQSFFEKSGISYDQISTSDQPIQLVTAYFKQLGQKAWWLAESTPATFSFFNELDGEIQDSLRAYAFVHFPEIMGIENKTKFKNFAVWMVTERSVICPSLRDMFTGGGRKDIIYETGTYSMMPRILVTLKDCVKEVLDELDNSSPELLREDWEYPSPVPEDLEGKINVWIKVSSKYVGQSLQKINSNVSPDEFLRNTITYNR